MKRPTIDRVRIYRSAGMWCYAAWCGAEHDHNDTLPDAESEREARAAVAAMFPAAEVRRVPDEDTGSRRSAAAAAPCEEGCDVWTPYETGDTGSAPRPMFD